MIMALGQKAREDVDFIYKCGEGLLMVSLSGLPWSQESVGGAGNCFSRSEEGGLFFLRNSCCSVCMESVRPGWRATLQDRAGLQWGLKSKFLQVGCPRPRLLFRRKKEEEKKPQGQAVAVFQ